MQNIKKRLFFLDFIKAISIIAVVSFHSMFVPVETYQDSFNVLQLIFTPLRFAVPAFLVISFFLLERSFNKYESAENYQLTDNINLTQKRLIRILIPTLFWFSLAGAKFIIEDTSFAEIVQTYLTGQIFTGAYYLLILLQAVPIFFLVRKKFSQTSSFISVLLLQAVFYLSISSILNSYGDTTIVTTLQNIGRSLLIYWLAYIAIGVYFYHHQDWLLKIFKKISFPAKALILLMTALTTVLEYQQFSLANDSGIQPFEYKMVSYIVSTFIIFICCIGIDENTFSPKITATIKTLSKYSLGIFCINGILSRYLAFAGNLLFADYSFGFVQILAIKLIGWFVLFMLSLGLSILIYRVGFKNLVC